MAQAGGCGREVRNSNLPISGAVSESARDILGIQAWQQKLGLRLRSSLLILGNQGRILRLREHNPGLVSGLCSNLVIYHVNQLTQPARLRGRRSVVEPGKLVTRFG